MDVYELEYYKLNRYYLSLVGLWPYMNLRTKRIRMFAVTFIFAIILLAQLLKIVTSKLNLKLLIEILSNLFLSVCFIFIYATVCLHEKQVHELFEQIRVDWCQLQSDEEYQILKKYAMETRLYTIIITLVWHVSLYSIIFFVLLPVLFDIIIPLNGPRSHDLPFPIELFFDTSKYFPISFTMLFICLHVMGNALIASFSSYSIVIQHSAALFVLIGHIFESTMRSYEKTLTDPAEEKKFYGQFLRGVWFHKRTIKFTATVNAVCQTCYFFEISFGMILVCVDILRLLQTQITLENSQELVTCCLHIIGNLSWILGACYLGQKVLDTSSNLNTIIFNANWYSYSTKIQKLILMVIIRSMKSCHVTIGKLFVSSLEFFLTIMRTTVSYTMVFYSLQQ